MNSRINYKNYRPYKPLLHCRPFVPLLPLLPKLYRRLTTTIDTIHINYGPLPPLTAGRNFYFKKQL